MRLSWLCSLLDDGALAYASDRLGAGDRSDFRDEKMAGIAPTRKKIEEMRHGGQTHFSAYILGFTNVLRERHGTRKNIARWPGAVPWPGSRRSARSRQRQTRGQRVALGGRAQHRFSSLAQLPTAFAGGLLRRVAPCSRSRRSEPSAALRMDAARHGRGNRGSELRSGGARACGTGVAAAIRLPRRDWWPSAET